MIHWNKKKENYIKLNSTKIFSPKIYLARMPYCQCIFYKLIYFWYSSHVCQIFLWKNCYKRWLNNNSINPTKILLIIKSFLTLQHPFRPKIIVDPQAG